MSKKTSTNNLADNIESLNMNGLEGRMLSLQSPANKKRNILFVYGHHSRLEYWLDYAKLLNRYGSVTVPDLPGFGGMEGLRKIGERPTLNNWAGYLAAFIKLRYKKRSQITIIGAGFGFVVATRMLMRYPDIAKRVDFIVGIDGIAHGDDLNINSGLRQKLALKNSVKHNMPTAVQLFYGKNSLNNIYRKTLTKNNYRRDNLLFFNANPEDDAELWRVNDMRSHTSALRSMLRLDNCIKKIDIPVWQVIHDGFFLDVHNIEQHLGVAYSQVNMINQSAKRKSKKSDFNFNELLPAKIRKELSGKQE